MITYIYKCFCECTRISMLDVFYVRCAMRSVQNRSGLWTIFNALGTGAKYLIFVYFCLQRFNEHFMEITKARTMD